jgi:hypothetical protein
MIDKSVERDRKRQAARKAARKYYWANPEKCRERTRKIRLKNKQRPWVAMAMRARHRAKQKKLDCNITAEYLQSIWPSNNLCPVLHIPLKNTSKGKPSEGSPSLDRIIPEKGYVKGNVIIVSHKANTIKSDASPKEIWRVFKHYNNLLDEIPLIQFKGRRKVATHAEEGARI